MKAYVSVRPMTRGIQNIIYIWPPVYGFMNVYKNEANMILVGGVIRATLEECKEAGKVAPNENLEWFCVARVELLDEEEGGNGHD